MGKARQDRSGRGRSLEELKRSGIKALSPNSGLGTPCPSRCPKRMGDIGKASAIVNSYFAPFNHKPTTTNMHRPAVEAHHLAFGRADAHGEDAHAPVGG